MTEIEINRENVNRWSLWSPEEIALLRRLHAEGVVFSVIAQEVGHSYQATISKANRLGLERRTVTKRTAPIGPIGALVAKHFGLHPDMLPSPCKPTRIVHARQIAIWLAIKLGHGFAPTGRYFRRDHTTMIHAVRRIEARRQRDDSVRELTDALLAVLQENAPAPPPKPAPEPEPPEQPEDEMPASGAPAVFYEQTGGDQTKNTRGYLKKQNERFAAAMRAALEGTPC